MSKPRPRFITFDCYGTLTRFQMAEMAREIFAGSVSAENMERVVRDFAAYRFDEVLGAWKPYLEVLASFAASGPAAGGGSSTAIGRRPVRRLRGGADLGAASRRARAAGANCQDIPLVILSNASNDQIGPNVAKLGAPFMRC